MDEVVKNPLPLINEGDELPQDMINSYEENAGGDTTPDSDPVAPQREEGNTCE